MSAFSLGLTLQVEEAQYRESRGSASQQDSAQGSGHLGPTFQEGQGREAPAGRAKEPASLRPQQKVLGSVSFS